MTSLYHEKFPVDVNCRDDAPLPPISNRSEERKGAIEALLRDIPHEVDDPSEGRTNRVDIFVATQEIAEQVRQRIENCGQFGLGLRVRQIQPRSQDDAM